jgi:hypothetical protein
MLEYFSEHTYNMRKMCNVGALHATPDDDVGVCYFGRCMQRPYNPVSDRRMSGNFAIECTNFGN